MNSKYNTTTAIAAEARQLLDSLTPAQRGCAGIAAAATALLDAITNSPSPFHIVGCQMELESWLANSDS